MCEKEREGGCREGCLGVTAYKRCQPRVLAQIAMPWVSLRWLMHAPTSLRCTHNLEPTYTPSTGQPITILDPGCTRKTFPTYFDVLEGVTVR